MEPLNNAITSPSNICATNIATYEWSMDIGTCKQGSRTSRVGAVRNRESVSAHSVCFGGVMNDLQTNATLRHGEGTELHG